MFSYKLKPYSYYLFEIRYLFGGFFAKKYTKKRFFCAFLLFVSPQCSDG